MLVYHGTDEDSARSILVNGLNEKEAEAAAGGAGLDPKGFSVTEDVDIARHWASSRALERMGSAERGVVLQADANDLPLTKGSPGEWTDPGESFIRLEDYASVGPGVFQVVP